MSEGFCPAWFGAWPLQAVHIVAMVVSLALLAFYLAGTLLRACCGVALCTPALGDLLTKAPRKGAAQLRSQYGLLLGPIYNSSRQEDVDSVDGVVNRWIVKGAIAALCHAGAMLLFAESHRYYTGHAEIVETFFLFICKCIVAICARRVHTNLSAQACVLVGKWVLLLAWSKAAMAVFWLCMCGGYVASALVSREASHPDPTDSRFCLLLLAFCFGAMLALALQSAAAFAMYRIQECALAYVVDANGTGCVVGWWVALVTSTFLVGLSLQSLALLMVLTGWTYIEHTADIYLCASAAQAVAGVSMVGANVSIKAYFRAHPDREDDTGVTMVGLGQEQGEQGTEG